MHLPVDSLLLVAAPAFLQLAFDRSEGQHVVITGRQFEQFLDESVRVLPIAFERRGQQFQLSRESFESRCFLVLFGEMLKIALYLVGQLFVVELVFGVVEVVRIQERLVEMASHKGLAVQVTFTFIPGTAQSQRFRRSSLSNRVGARRHGR